MRVDLHAHTQKCKQGDAPTRVIAPEAFVEKMRENGVGICSITNHNKIDTEEYTAVRELVDDIVVLPGVELDLVFDGHDRQMIVVCNPDQLERFYEVFDNDPGRNLDEYKIDYSDFKDQVSQFNKEDLILIAHFMNKAKGFKPNEREELYKDLEGRVLILEPSNLMSMGFVNGHGEALSLVGSDVQDWSKYSYDDLPELKFKIDSYSRFHELCSDPRNFVKNYLNGAQKYVIQTDDGDIEVFDDVNVIFGEKGSGKTKLLRKIEPQLRNLGKEVALHMGDKYEQRYSDLIEARSSSLKVDEDKIKIVRKEIDYVLSYREQAHDNFIQKIMTFRSDQNKNKQAAEIAKRHSSFSNDLDLDVDELLDTAQGNVDTIDETKAINADYRTAEDKHKLTLDQELSLLAKDVLDQTSEEYHEYFTAQSTEEMLKAIKESVKRNGDTESLPSNIGFSKMVSSRLKRLESNKNIIDTLDSLKDSRDFSLGNLPSKGEVTLGVSISVYGGEPYDAKSVFDKNSVVRDRWMLRKLKSFSPQEFAEINSYFDDSDEDFEIPSGKEFTDHVVRKVKRTRIQSSDDYEPSPGEKAILSISSILESNEFDCYLFDEIEKGLGNKYVAEFVIPKIKELRDKGKCIVLTTHDANIAVSTLPSQTVYCEYPNEEVYYIGNMYCNELVGVKSSAAVNWLEKAMVHLEGGDKMFAIRRNIYG